jgi:acyl-CoA synthetase (AMP-forming)/AMP-acid ligase II
MSWEEFNKRSHFVCDYVEKWAKDKPEDIVLIDADDGKYVTWELFQNNIYMYALELIDMGYKKGDIIITQLPLLLEHIYLMYACYKIGVIICPLDFRLKEDEVVRCTQLLEKKARMFIHPDDTDSEDRFGKKKFYPFKQHAVALKKNCPFIKDYIQFGLEEDAPKGTIGILNFTQRIRKKWLDLTKNPELLSQKFKLVNEYSKKVDESDPVLIIYTTGSTGFPKPSLLTNIGMTSMQMCMTKGLGVVKEDRILINLPPSHVAGTTMQLGTGISAGIICVILHAFKADKTVKAIQDFRITVFGQIPSLFVMEWRLPDYKEYDLSSLRYVLYGGQGVSRRFLEKMKTMAPYIGSGLGMTEMHGFVSYTALDATVDDIVDNLGYALPITPLSIRKPLNEDGTAGEELSTGEEGEICYTGPQVFAGYFGNEEATNSVISKPTDPSNKWSRVYYTGDMGFKDEKGNLHLAGRRKFILKPKGYQVYPPEVEAYIEKFPDVAMAGVIGYEHEVFSEGIVVFVEMRRGKEFSAQKIKEHYKGLAAYKRPLLTIPIEEMPLNRIDKTDYMVLKNILPKYIEEERSKGRWDA